ncbi:SPARC-related modular calcium-binding protein 1-like [Alosa pseudoharengus]|uniref:SPARC-related modular calcium-binding protein 1-like n=1 Tax=Alosa pseudoharengus TaxID=34774 RepID=UPI003F8AFF4C
MLAFTFTCRVLLLALVTDTVQTVDKSQFLITENMWPRGCVLDCTRGRHRSVCGSNGRLYKSLCAFQRAQCINTQLKTAPRAHCMDPYRSKCQLARSQAMESSIHTDTIAVFVPECNVDGSFMQVQCHNQTGYCWCSTPDGKPVSGTSVLLLKPNCTGPLIESVQEVDSESEQRDGNQWRLTPDPERLHTPSIAGITAPPFWVTIQLNSDPKGNRSAKRPTGEKPKTCERERMALLAEVRSMWQEERFIPECSTDGRYSPIQCHTATGYCWCVRVDTGRPLPGTSTRNRLPDCSPEESRSSHTTNTDRDRPLPGCPGSRKAVFLQSLTRALQLQAHQAGLMPAERMVEESRTESPPSPASEPVSPAASGPGAAESALQWHFLQLDVDGDGVLSEREARPLRQYLRRTLKPRRCAKKFTQYCDQDRDAALSLVELNTCLGL